MRLPGFLNPQDNITEGQTARGLRMGVWQVAAAGGLEGITSGGFLVAFALALGANNLEIGILTAIPFFMQPTQILAVLLLEKLRRRKLVAISAYLFTQSAWIPVALIPLVLDVPSAPAVSALLVIMALRGAANAFFSAGWLGWLRDVVPQNILGKYFSRRQAWSIGATAVIGLAAAFYIDQWRSRVASEQIIYGYTLAYLLGAVALGWLSVAFMSFVPEPRVRVPEGQRPPFLQTIAAPFKDRNFRQLINFLFFWNLAANLALPFFTVYMLRSLEMPLTAVIALGALSQVSRVLFVRMWGPLADMFGSKVVISLGVSLFLLVFLGWTFVGTPDPHFLTTPLLIALHVFMGAAAAAINLADMTLRMKLAPPEQANSYLTGASLAINLGSGVSPLLGGYLVDFFSVRELTISLTWVDPNRVLELPAWSLTGYGFLFVLAFVVGLLTLNTLTTIREEGEVDRQVVLEELLGEARENMRSVATTPGLGFMSWLPYDRLRLRRSPLPGLDVAVGLTAYQIAASAQAAVSAAVRGRAAARAVSERVGDVVAAALEEAHALGVRGEEQLNEIARHATRGAMHAIDDAPELAMDTGHLARNAVAGALKAFRNAISVSRAQILHSAGYGAVQGAAETGASVAEAAAHAVAGARQTARELGLPEDQAAEAAAQGALAAAEQLGPEAAALAREALAVEASGATQAKEPPATV